MTKHVLLQGDALDTVQALESESVDIVMSSPPYYGHRDYDVKGQWGLEDHPQEWIDRQVQLFRELRRVLKPSGSIWWVVGDSYCGSWGGQGKDAKGFPKRTPLSKLQNGKWLQPKQLMLLPSRLAAALQDDNWILRNKVIWRKPNPQPSSAPDRFSNTYEEILFFTKEPQYFFDLDNVRVPHKRGTPISERDYKRMMAGRQEFKGKRKGSGLQNAFVAGNPKGKNPGDVMNITQEKRRTKRWYSNPGHDQTHVRKWVAGTGDDFWNIAKKPLNEKGAHFAIYPEALCKRVIKAACPKDGVILDPFVGSGTTMVAAMKLNRNSIGIELNPTYCKTTQKRLLEQSAKLSLDLNKRWVFTFPDQLTLEEAEDGGSEQTRICNL